MRLVGYVDGVMVSFDYSPPATFKAVIPRQLDGVYIVELHLDDDAGNETFYSNVFVRIDFQQLKVEVLPESFACAQNGLNLGYKISSDELDVKGLNAEFGVREIAPYSFRELVMG